MGAIDGVVAASDEYVASAAALSTVLTPRKFDPRLVVAWRDKAVQKHVIAGHGISTADWFVIDDIGAVPSQAAFEVPAVIKPCAAAGAAGVRVVEKNEDLPRIAEELTRLSARRTYIVESFVAGNEYQIDAVIQGGQLMFASVACYGVSPIQVLAGRPLRAYTIDPVEHAQLQRECECLAERTATALGVADGVLHLEAFYNQGHLTFGECGVRLGGQFTPEMVKAKHGIDLAEVCIQQACGISVVLKPSLTSGVFCRAHLPTTPGILLDLPNVDEVLSFSAVQAVEIQHAVGSTLGDFRRNAATRLGEVLVAGDSVADVNASVDDLIDWFSSRVVVRPA